MADRSTSLSNNSTPSEKKQWKYLEKQKMREVLTPLQYHITQEKGTEKPHSGAYVKVFDNGCYTCVVCGHELFSSEGKYASHCGWATFHKASYQTGSVDRAIDTFDGLVRTEVKCSKCGAHLGHVFDDGPKKFGGDRYCINSASLKFQPSSNAHNSNSQ